MTKSPQKNSCLKFRNKFLLKKEPEPKGWTVTVLKLNEGFGLN